MPEDSVKLGVIAFQPVALDRNGLSTGIMNTHTSKPYLKSALLDVHPQLKFCLYGRPWYSYNKEIE